MEPRKKKKVRGGNRTPLLQQTNKQKKPAESDSVVFLKNAPGDSPQVKQV